MSLSKTPLGRVRGLGAAKHGVGHFIGQRVSAVALVFLVAWAVWSGLRLAGYDYSETVAWLRSGPNTVLTVLLIAAGFYHMSLGMRTVIEDYIHKTLTRAALLIASQFACVVFGVSGVIAVLKVALGGGVS